MNSVPGHKFIEAGYEFGGAAFHRGVNERIALAGTARNGNNGRTRGVLMKRAAKASSLFLGNGVAQEDQIKIALQELNDGKLGARRRNHCKPSEPQDPAAGLQ